MLCLLFLTLFAGKTNHDRDSFRS